MAGSLIQQQVQRNIDVEKLVVESEKEFQVHTNVYTDPDIFNLEMEKIFGKVWVYVAHESEIKKPGDYKTTMIGKMPIIVSRAEDEKVHAFFNRCRHRGSVVCRMEQGHANFFRCPYHGWVYGNDGKLAGIAQASGYPEDIDHSQLGLMQVPRLEIYRGLIFVSLNPEICDLEEYFGEMKKYLDLHLDRSPTGEIDLRYGSNCYEYQGNWKFQSENNTDGYHGNYVHESFYKVQEQFGLKSGQHGNYTQTSMKEIKSFRNQGFTRGFKYGHGILEYPITDEAMEQLRTGKDSDYYNALVEEYGIERIEEILTQYNIFIFPNLAFIQGQVRVIQPLAVDRTEVTVYPCALTGASENFNVRRLRAHERFHGNAGFGAPDDVEIFALNQEGLKVNQVEWLILTRGLHREQRVGGEWVGHSTDETPQRALYREWVQLMK